VVVTQPDLAGVVLEGRYRVGELLAKGGMSRVYRGTDLRLDREVAIKVMEAGLAADPSFRARFEREARAIAKIDHPCVVDVYDQGEHGGPGDPVVYLVMELVVGGTLRDVLAERGSLPAPEALAVLEPVLGALAAAHAQGMTHRDVKPENVLISRAGTVKVADFGLVTAAAQARASTAGVILGTMAYLSPEQVLGRTVDARGDVYSAGVVLFELLTGVPPYDGEQALTVAYRHVNEDVPAPSTLVPGLPPALDELVLAATRRDPDARPADAETLLHALLGVRAALGLPRARIPVPHRAAPGPRPPGRPLSPGPGATPRGATPPGGAPVDPPRPAAPRPTRALTSVVDPGGAATPGTTGAPGHRAVDASPWRGGEPADHVARRRRSSRILAVWIGAVLLLAVLIGALAWGAGAAQWTSMPALVGMDQAGAQRTLTDAGLVPVIRQAPQDTIPAGRVAATDPAPGASVRRGGSVTLTVSTGRPRVPDIPPGTAVADAQRILRDAGLTPSGTSPRYASDDTAPRGTVVGTDPEAGTAVHPGQPVDLVLSSGPAPTRHGRGRNGSDEDPGQSFSDRIRDELEKALGGG
jgi:serine/threonine-protein kinase